MSVTYIRWPVAIDEQFRARYLAATGERIQSRPEVSENGRHYMVSSWRITQSGRDALLGDGNIPGMQIDLEWPEDWRGKDREGEE